MFVSKALLKGKTAGLSRNVVNTSENGKNRLRLLLIFFHFLNARLVNNCIFLLWMSIKLLFVSKHYAGARTGNLTSIPDKLRPILVQKMNRCGLGGLAVWNGVYCPRESELCVL